MKRSREEVYSGPPFNRPFNSTFPRADLYGNSQAPVAGGNGVSAIVNVGNSAVGGDAAGGTQKLTTNDALSYLKQVKDMFQDQRGKYDCFLDVMKDFKGQRIDTAGVIRRVKELFKGHPDLILGFNTFLPKGYEISLTDDEQVLPPKRTVEFEEAISFVNKIKKRFQNDDHIYKSFLDILNMYRKEHKSITEVYREVATLFRGHTDLLEEFTKFLPDTSASTAHSNGSLSRHFFNHNDEKNPSLSAMRNTYTEKRQIKERVLERNIERDFSVERPDTEDDKTAIKMLKEQKKLAERESRDKMNCDMNARDLENDNLDVNVHRVSEKRKSSQKSDDFGGAANFASSENRDALKSAYSNEFLFCEKVKERLNNADDYQDFLKCLHLYSQEIISRHELQDLVAAIIGKHEDLLECFHEFLQRCERMDGFLPGVMGKKSSWNESNTSKLLKIESKEKEHRREGEGGKEKERPNSKYLGKSIQELDLSNSECCTPSYRLLPDDYPMSFVSQRSELGNQVLNDKWVSVTSGSEDYSFKHMRRNQYEESLFRCEDDRFELDMLLESVSSTSKRAEELLNGLTDNSIGTEGPIRIEDHFTALNLRCIARLYGDHGLDVMDILRKNPSLALPVILTRLKQKQEEWTKCRSDFNKVWAEIYQKNHAKTLDHRSFYFKQQDSKNLSTKSLVAEIKEIKEKMQKEDDAVLSFAAGSRHSCKPHMEFEYADADVQDDVFRIIKYSCEEICSTKDQLQKVMRLWTNFVEPILGVRSRSYGVDTTGDGGTKHKVLKSGENEGEPISDAAVALSKEIRSYNEDAATSSQLTNFNARMVNMVGGMKDGQDISFSERDNIPATSRPNANHVSVASTAHVRNGPIDGVDNTKHVADDRLSSEQGEEVLKLNQSANFEFGDVSRPIGYKEDLVGPCMVEKEEGELSPNCDFEDNFASSQECSLQAVPEENGINVKIEAQIGINDDVHIRDKDDVGPDDEDSENISVDGEDVSGSESASDECSREEREEEEDVEPDEMDAKVESEGETEIAGGDGGSLPPSEQYLLTCKPVCKLVSMPFAGDVMRERQVLYGNDSLYVLFRLHQTLYERMLFAKMHFVYSESRCKMTKEATSDPSARFINALFNLLDGSYDNTKFEDDCRSLIGNQAYVLFTLDKLIYKLVKQLQIVSSDEVCCKLLQLFDYEQSRKPQKYVDSVHYENVHVLLHDENVYRIECTYNPTRLSFQLMDDGSEKAEVVAVSIDPGFATYLQYDYLSADHGRKELSGIILRRNMQKYHNLDESPALVKATESTRTINGLECKMASTTSKISYVLDTADYFIRLGRTKYEPADQRSQARKAAATQRFRRFLESSNLQ